MSRPPLEPDAIAEIEMVIEAMDREVARQPVDDDDAPMVLSRLLDERLPRWQEQLRAALIPPAPPPGRRGA